METVFFDVKQSPRSTGVMRLSRRQVQILTLIADGCSGKEIARMLSVSPRTVESHVQRLFDRHGVRNRAGLVAKWMEEAVPDSRATSRD